jgi:inorganic pyrophosphatase
MDGVSTHRPHPWHGLDVGPEPPALVTAYIEITPRDVVKYELDKASGLLKVDRLLETSSSPPTLYGLIPRTYCGSRVAALAESTDVADGDPLDICVFSERPIDKADIILTARVVGGLRMIDGDEADDKIVAVLANDPTFEGLEELAQLPATMADRLDHYFRTYKQGGAGVMIEARYGAADAQAVVVAAMADYDELMAGGGPVA